MSRSLYAKISDFCETGSGTTPSRQKAERYYGGKIPWVKSGELRESEITETEEMVTSEALKETSLKLVPAGALLVAMYGATVGRVGQLGIEATTNQAICHIVPDPTVANKRYMFHALCAKASELVGKGVGGAQPNINQRTIKETTIYLPALEEQQRIAAILDQANDLRRKRQHALTRINQLGQAIFHEMFGDPLGAPNAEIEWTTESLESNVEFMDYRGKTPLKADTGIRLITARNVKMGFINLEPQEFVEAESYGSWMTRGFPERGDVLFTTEAPLGHVAQLDTDETVVIGQRLITMKPNRELIHPTYLEFFLRTPTFRTKMFENSTGSTVVGIKSKLLKKIDIRYPGAKFQDKFDVAIRQLRATVPHFENSVQKMEALFVSLQYRAFRRELSNLRLKEVAT